MGFHTPDIERRRPLKERVLVVGETLNAKP